MNKNYALGAVVVGLAGCAGVPTADPTATTSATTTSIIPAPVASAASSVATGAINVKDRIFGDKKEEKKEEAKKPAANPSAGIYEACDKEKLVVMPLATFKKSHVPSAPDYAVTEAFYKANGGAKAFEVKSNVDPKKFYQVVPQVEEKGAIAKGVDAAVAGVGKFIPFAKSAAPVTQQATDVASYTMMGQSKKNADACRAAVRAGKFDTVDFGVK